MISVRTITPEEALGILMSEKGLLKGDFVVKGEISIPKEFPFDSVEISCGNRGISVHSKLKDLLILNGETGNIAVCDDASVETLLINSRVKRLSVGKMENGIPGRVGNLQVEIDFNSRFDAELNEIQVFRGGIIENASILANTHITRAFVNNYVFALQLQMQGVKTFISQRDIEKGLKQIMAV